jgi:hypothetical protein
MKKLLLGAGLALVLIGCQPTTPPVITVFTAAPTTVVAGATARLSWTVSGADSLEIDQGVGGVTGTQSKDVTVASSTTYTLTAKNASGAVTKSVNVVAQEPAGGAKIIIQNWPAGQTGQIGGGLTSTMMIPFPSISVAANGTVEYALGTSTGGQAGNIACSGNAVISSSNPTARLLGIGLGYGLTPATVGSGSSSTGTIYVANRLFTSSAFLDGDKVGALLYASEATTLTGTCGGLTYNASLVAGWNYLLVTFAGAGNTRNGTVSASVSLPTDMKWYYVTGNPIAPAR